MGYSGGAAQVTQGTQEASQEQSREHERWRLMKRDQIRRLTEDRDELERQLAAKNAQIDACVQQLGASEAGLHDAGLG